VYLLDEVFGAMASPNPLLVIGVNIDYALGGLLLWWSALNTVASAPQSEKPKKA